MSALQGFLNTMVQYFGDETYRLVKLRGLFFGLKILKNFRKITLVYFFAFIIFMLFTASLFSVLIYNLKSASLQWDAFNVTVSSIALISLALLSWSLREKRWLEIFGFEDEIMKISKAAQAIPRVNEPPSLDRRDLEDLIEQVFERKFRQYAKKEPESAQTDFFH